MLARLPEFVGLNEVTHLLAQIIDLRWEDGAATAQAAAGRKHNEQLTQQHPIAGPLLTQLATRIAQHPAVVRWAVGAGLKLSHRAGVTVSQIILGDFQG